MMASTSESAAKTGRFYDATNLLLDIVHKQVNPETLTASYEALLEASRWHDMPALKSLTAKYIPDYFRYFPTLHEFAIDAQLDLCEDDDIKVRKESIRNLPLFCAQGSQYAQRIADVLLQLLQVEFADELAVVKTALVGLFHKYPRQVLDAMALRMAQPLDQAREGIFKFLQSSYAELPKTAQIEQELAKSVYQSLLIDSVTESELAHGLRLLQSWKFMDVEKVNLMMTTLNKHAEQLHLDAALTTDEHMDKMTHLINAFFPLLSKRHPGNKLFDGLIRVASDLKFAELFPSTDQGRILRVACELMQSNGAIAGAPHLELCYKTLQNIYGLNTGTLLAEEIDFQRFEPLLYIIYSISFKLSSEPDGIMASRLRETLLSSQIAKDLYGKRMNTKGTPEGLALAKKNFLAASNVNAFIKEILKPTKSRQSITPLLSWRPVPPPSAPVEPMKRKDNPSMDASPSKKIKKEEPVKDQKKAKDQVGQKKNQQPQKSNPSQKSNVPSKSNTQQKGQPQKGNLSTQQKGSGQGSSQQKGNGSNQQRGSGSIQQKGNVSNQQKGSGSTQQRSNTFTQQKNQFQKGPLNAQPKKMVQRGVSKKVAGPIKIERKVPVTKLEPALMNQTRTIQSASAPPPASQNTGRKVVIMKSLQ